MKLVQTFVIAALLVCSSALARNEMLTVTKSNPTGISVSVSGNIAYCDAQLGSIVGSPVLNIVGTTVNVQSTITVGECAPPPPGFVPPPPVPYSITVPLGNLSDGTYSVHWSFVGGIPQTFSTTFIVVHGELVTLPVLSPITLGLLALALATCGIRAVRS
jgi:hypothetical protein